MSLKRGFVGRFIKLQIESPNLGRAAIAFGGATNYWVSQADGPPDPAAAGDIYVSRQVLARSCSRKTFDYTHIVWQSFGRHL